jgi:2-hydroxyacyl-CoA lyase 1
MDQAFTECAARGIRLIGARHQQSAVLMAASANYLAGRLESVVVVSAGPGVTNALTGVLVARDNGWPIIVIGGRRPLHQEGMGYFQELDAVPIFASVTKWAARIDCTTEIMRSVITAFTIACSGRPGPVYLDLPQDVLEGTAPLDDSPCPVLEGRPEAELESVVEAARIIRSGSRPLMILGEGIRWGYCLSHLERIAGEFGIPFITSPMGRGFLPDDHPLCANDARRWIQSQADVVLLAGAWFDWRFRFGAELAPEARIIHVDINPDTLGKNVEPVLTIHADSGRFLSQLAEEMLELSIRDDPGTGLQSWHGLVQGVCGENRRERAERLAGNPKSLAFYRLYQAIRDFLPPKAVIVLDGGINLAMGQALLSARGPCCWMDPGWNGCMGVGIPFGLGAKLVSPDHMVVVICGDYSFGLTAIDLETAVRCGIPIIVVIANNNGINGAARQKLYLPPDHAERFCQFQPAVRYEQIMKAFGGHAEWVNDPTEMRHALERAAASGLPACINVSVDPDTPHPGTW